MSSLLQITQNLTEHFNDKLKNFCYDVRNVHVVWLHEIQQEAYRMFSSDFSTEPELMPKTPSQKKTNRRKRLSIELNESRNKRRFSKGKRSNLSRSSVQSTLNTISELLSSQAMSNSPESPQETVRRTLRQRNTLLTEAEPVKRSTRTKGGTKAKEEPVENEVSPNRLVMSEVVVSIPSTERLSAEKLLKPEVSPGRSAKKIHIADSKRRTTVRRSRVVRQSLVGLRHSMTQDAVRRASRRSFLKKAKLGNSTSSTTDRCLDEPEDLEVDAEELVDAEQKQDAVMETKPHEIVMPSDPEPAAVEDENEPLVMDANHSEPEATSPRGEAENCRFTRSMKRQSDSVSSLTTDHSGECKSSSGSEERLTCSGSKRQAMEKVCTPKTKNPPLGKKCLTGVAPHMRAFIHTVQKNQMLMTPGSLGRSSVMKSFIKVAAPKVDIKFGSGSVERERQKWDAFNKKIELENERKKRIEEEKRKKQEEMKRKRDERVKRVVETRVKGEKEKELEKKKKIEEKLAQQEKKSDMLRVERMAEEKAKKKVATKRQEELELRKKQEEAARQKKLQQKEEERRHQEMLSKRKAEEEREKARKQAEMKKEQEREREQQAARVLELKLKRENERLEEEKEKEKAVALQKELERREMELRRKMREEEKRDEEEREELKRREAAAAAVVPPAGTAQVLKLQAASVLNQTITKSPALNLTIDVENSLMKTPVGKGAAHNKTMVMGAGLNVTVDIEKSPQTYQITPKGQKVAVLVNPDDYGMDQQSDDSTDDESDPKKPIPSWAQGMKLQQSLMKQYYNPPDLDSYFGEPEPPRLEEIFSQTKPRFFKRTSSAVWHLPPNTGF